MTEKKLKGGRKGGATFPRVDLKQAVMYAKKLVSKTHTGTQPQSVIYPGVFGVISSRGGPKASALKQFKLMKGNLQAFQATDLAKSITVTPDNEAKDLLVESLLSVKLFKISFDTFKGDSVSGTKIKQQAASHNVHPDSLDEFLSVFVKSCIFAGLASKDGDDISFTSDTHTQELENQVEESEEENNISDDIRNLEDTDSNTEIKQKIIWNSSHKADIQIKIDPSMDPEKLDKLLSVLKKYGQL